MRIILELLVNDAKKEKYLFNEHNRMAQVGFEQKTFRSQ